MISLTTHYLRWQQVFFWISWVALFLPGFFLAFGTARLANLLWHGYRDQADVTIFGIFCLGLFATVLIGILSYWAYSTASRRYWQVMLWQLVGLLLVPLLTLTGSLLVYYQLVVLAT